MQAFRRQGFRQLVLWLALAMAGLRVLLPEGFMPQRGPAGNYGLAICYAGPLARLRAEQGAPAGAHAHTQGECPFAAAAGPVLVADGQSWLSVAGTHLLQPQQLGVIARGSPPRLLPPARAPPQFS